MDYVRYYKMFIPRSKINLKLSKDVAILTDLSHLNTNRLVYVYQARQCSIEKEHAWFMLHCNLQN